MIETLRCRPAEGADLSFIEDLLRRSAERADEGIGYPRCDEAGELEAELKLYELPLEDAFFVLEGPNEAHAGTFGLLYAADLDYGFLAGPLLVPGARSPKTMRDALQLAEDTARQRALPRLRNAVVDENTLLTCTLEQAGWARLGGNLEMIYELEGRSEPAPPAGSDRIEPLSGPDDPLFAPAAGLLGVTHGWKDDPTARLLDCLRQGARVACIRRDGQVAGAVVWIHLSGTSFSRIDYVSALPELRRQGIGSALVAYALCDIHAAGARRAYLALDPANEAAHRLYLKMGFTDNVRSTLFALDLSA